MRNKVKLFVLLIMVSIQLAAQVPAKTVPEFNFARFDRTSFTNKDLAKSKMLFFIFFDAECDHCHRAIAYLNDHYDKFKSTAIYLITLDGKEKVDKLMFKYAPHLKEKFNITLLQDVRNEFIQKFGPRKYPSIFLYSPGRELLLYDDNEQSMIRVSRKINQHS